MSCIDNTRTHTHNETGHFYSSPLYSTGIRILIFEILCRNFSLVIKTNAWMVNINKIEALWRA